MIKNTIYVYLIIIATSNILFGCNSRNERVSNTKPNNKKDNYTTKIEDKKIGRVTFFLENSGSMFGYVDGTSGITEFVDVVSELAEKPDFVNDKTLRDFYFINGIDLQITPLGNNPQVLIRKLNRVGYNCGSVSNSNLNSMFQKAMSVAGGENVSVLISDGIYDVGAKSAPFAALAIEGRETRSRFIERLKKSNLQTILIKLKSKFKGDYCFASRPGSSPINQQRPYYIWLFGESILLNKYFSDSYITEKLKGYENYARFLIINENAIPFQIVSSFNRKGTFKLDRQIKNKIIDVKPDRKGQGFQFAVAVDFSSLPFSDSYLTSISNYDCNLNYKPVKIERIEANQKFEITTFKNPTHIITVSTDKNPYGNLEIVLKNEIPNWIKETDIDNETHIDSYHTFGFKFLTNAISEAYAYKNNGKNIASFKIEISK